MAARFFLRYNPGDEHGDCWELCERAEIHGHEIDVTLAAFWDGDHTRSRLAGFLLAILNEADELISEVEREHGAEYGAEYGAPEPAWVTERMEREA